MTVGSCHGSGRGRGVSSSCLFLPLLARFPSPNKVFVKIPLAEHWGCLDLSCGWRRGGGMGSGCCVWCFPPAALLLLLEEVSQLPPSLFFMSHSHETMTRPPCVDLALPRVGNSGHFWGVQSSRGSLAAELAAGHARSSGQRHAPGVPVGHDTGTGGAGRGSVLDVESVCSSVTEQKPQASSRAFARGLQRSGDTLEDAFCAGLCWGAGSLSCCFSLGARSNFCHLSMPSIPHLCKTRRRYFPRDAQQRSGLALGQGSGVAVLGVLHSVLGLPTCAPHRGVAVEVETLLWPPGSRAVPGPAPPAPT